MQSGRFWVFRSIKKDKEDTKNVEVHQDGSPQEVRLNDENAKPRTLSSGIKYDMKKIKSKTKNKSSGMWIEGEMFKRTNL